MLSLALAVGLLGMAGCGAGGDETGDAERGGGPARVCVVHVPLRGVIGATVRAEDVRGVLGDVERAVRACGRGVIVVEVSSDGGTLAHVGALVDVMTEELASIGEVVVYVDRALSAAALVALSGERIVFAPAGVMGSAFALSASTVGERPRALDEAETELALRVGAECARRGGHDLAISRAMQTPVGLWWRAGGGGGGEVMIGVGLGPEDAEVVSRVGEFAVLNALDASAMGLSLGTAEGVRGAAEAYLGGDGGVGSVEVVVELGVGERLVELESGRAAALAELERLWRRALAAESALVLGGPGSGTGGVAERAAAELERAALSEPVAAAYLGLDGVFFEELRTRISAFVE